MKTQVYYRIDEDAIYYRHDNGSVAWTWDGPIGFSRWFYPEECWELLGEL